MLAVAIANFRRMLKDIKVLIIIFTAPIVIMFAFSFLTGSSGGSSGVRIGIHDSSNSYQSKVVIEDFRQDSVFEVLELDRDEIEWQIKERELSVGLVIEKDFNQTKMVTVIEGKALVNQLVISKVNKSITQLLLKGWDKEIDLSKKSIRLDSKFKPSGLTFVMGFIINFIMYSMIYIVNDLMDLKKSQVLRRSYTTPHSSFTLLAGIVFSMFLLLGGQIIIINLSAYVMFKQWIIKSIIGGILLFIPYILVILSMGVIIARNIKNPDLTAIIVNLIVIPTGMISGTLMPKEMLPKFMEKFAFLSPQFWVVDGIQKANSGELLSIIQNSVILSLIALCLVVGSSYRFTSIFEE